MSPEKQRIAIAKACGWKDHDDPEVMKLKVGWTMPEKWCLDPKGVLRFNHDRPDYLHDLNAMHTAWKTCISFKDRVHPRYRRILRSICERDRGLFGEWDALNATAAQRAEAFLKTLNLWTDD